MRLCRSAIEPGLCRLPKMLGGMIKIEYAAGIEGKPFRIDSPKSRATITSPHHHIGSGDALLHRCQPETGLNVINRA